jgi:hypothetical protein
MPARTLSALAAARRERGDEGVRDVLRRAFAATPTPTVTAAAEALGTTRRWLRAEAAAVGYELPAPRPGPRARGPV